MVGLISWSGAASKVHTKDISPPFSRSVSYTNTFSITTLILISKTKPNNKIHHRSPSTAAGLTQDTCARARQWPAIAVRFGCKAMEEVTGLVLLIQLTPHTPSLARHQHFFFKMTLAPVESLHLFLLFVQWITRVSPLRREKETGGEVEARDNNWWWWKNWKTHTDAHKRVRTHTHKKAWRSHVMLHLLYHLRLFQQRRKSHFFHSYCCFLII